LEEADPIEDSLIFTPSFRDLANVLDYLKSRKEAWREVRIIHGKGKGSTLGGETVPGFDRSLEFFDALPGRGTGATSSS
jgi:hypothetical protein